MTKLVNKDTYRHKKISLKKIGGGGQFEGVYGIPITRQKGEKDINLYQHAIGWSLNYKEYSYDFLDYMVFTV